MAVKRQLSMVLDLNKCIGCHTCTSACKLQWTNREDRQAESFRKMLVAMAKDIRVILIKLADRLDNMRTLEHMPLDKQESIARETVEGRSRYSDMLARVFGEMGR